MGIPIDMKEVPRDWRRTLTLFGIMALGGGLVVAGFYGVKAVAKDEARLAVKEVLDEAVEKFKAAALEAARDGADRAVRDTVGPLTDKIRDVDSRQIQHKEVDDYRQSVTDDKQEKMDRRLERLERRER